MKKMKCLSFLVGCFFSVLSLSCSHMAVDDAEAGMYYTLVKFTQPEYKDYIIVTDYKGVDDYVLMRGNNCISNPNHLENELQSWPYEFSQRNHIPYWDLPNGWFLIDWAWFSYPYDASVLLTDLTWEDYNGSAYYDRSLPHIKGNIFEQVKRIAVADLMGFAHPDGNYCHFKTMSKDEYGHDITLEFDNEYDYLFYIHHLKYVSDDYFCICEKAEEMDNFWSHIQSQLTTIINNNDLDNIPVFNVNQLYK